MLHRLFLPGKALSDRKDNTLLAWGGVCRRSLLNPERELRRYSSEDRLRNHVEIPDRLYGNFAAKRPTAARKIEAAAAWSLWGVHGQIGVN